MIMERSEQSMRCHRESYVRVMRVIIEVEYWDSMRKSSLLGNKAAALQVS
jgi:hypothetical protein